MARTKQTARKTTGGESPRKQLATRAARGINYSSKKERVWTFVHKSFAEKSPWTGETYQQEWKKAGFSYQEAKEWLSLNFKPRDIYSVEQWKNYSFTPREVKRWTDIGLKNDDYDLAYYSKKQGHQPNGSNLSNLKELRKNFDDWLVDIGKNAQKWLDYFYPKEKRAGITFLNLSERELEDSLNLNDFVNLQLLETGYNNLIALDISNCSKLVYLDCPENQLTNSTLLFPKEGKKITFLNARNNKLEGSLELFSNLVDLEKLWLANNNLFGSLKPLQNLVNLRNLDIENTNINNGLEYLPENLNRIYCDGCKELEEELKPYLKEDRNSYGDEKNYVYYNYRPWKRWYLAKQLKNEKAKIPILENKIQELTDLIKSHKERIVNAYSHFFAEKELLKELITAHLAYTKAKQQNLSAFKLGRKCEDIKSQLINKLEKENEEELEELMDKVEIILKDCEELTHYETELQTQINQNQKLISHHESVIQQITYQINTAYISNQETNPLPILTNPNRITELIETTDETNKLIESLQKENKQQRLLLDVSFETSETVRVEELEQENTNLKRKCEALEAEKEQSQRKKKLEKNKHENWTTIHFSFTPELAQQWNFNNFTYLQTQEWIQVGFQPRDYIFCTWLRDTKHLSPKEILDSYNLDQLKAEYQQYQTQIEILPK